MSETKHILGLSGGKDSAALAVHMNKKYPDLDIEYFFTDTGYELKETYDFLNKLKTRLDKPIHYINPRNSFDYFLKKYNNFLPSPTARWCTIEMILKSMEAWLKPALDAGQEIITSFAVKPTSSIVNSRETIDKKGKNVKISVRGRHDPCVGIRAVPIGEAMLACVLLDHFLMNRAQCG